MADSVIRNDLIRLNLDLEGTDELKKLQKELNQLKRMLTGDMGGDAFEELQENAEESVRPLKKVRESVKQVTKEVTNLGKKAVTVAFTGLKKLAGISFKALVAGIGASAVAVGGLVKQSVSAYADYEQFIGGVETLFGAGGRSLEEYAKSTGQSVKKAKSKYDLLLKAQDMVFANADNAFKTTGLSANEYMENVTSFSASLIASCNNDTKKAAKLADTAMVDMADNANKMGSDMESIQNAYQGFSKDNYTMLDNLKLGFGGTKKEMERLIKTASKLDKNVKAKDMSFGNIVKAIHAIQVNMDIAGTTSKEAEGTISGSLGMVKAAWKNLMPALIEGGDSFDRCVNNLVYSIDKFAGNIKEPILKAISGVGKLIETLAPYIEKELPRLAEELLPPLIKAATSVVQGLIKALPNIIGALIKEIPNIVKSIGRTLIDTFGEQFPIVKKVEGLFDKIGNFFAENADKIKKYAQIIIPSIIGAVASFKLLSKGFNGIKKITSLFGRGSAGGKGGKGLCGVFKGILDTFKTLAKAKTKTILKGMANLAIVLGGITLLTAVFMAIAPFMAGLTDMKSFAKSLVAVTAIGFVAAALAELASIAGKIPVSTAVKGFANMAIVIIGMSALLLIINKMFKTDISVKKIVKISLMITAFGVVGGALAGFAGLVGMIPISLVLSGLAAIAAVIGGMTAIIAAFGALAQIDGFNEFMTEGGEALACVFTQIGKIGGSLAGGFGEGLTKSLPIIGDNLSKFAEAVKPLFSTLSGIDTGGVSDVLETLGTFLLKIGAKDALSFFGGETDLAEFGTQLNEFVDSSKGAFEKMASFPKEGIDNAKRLLQALAGIGNIPKTGGFIQHFFGNTDYEALVEGLGKLTNTKVLLFFTMTSVLPKAGFENAKLLFQSLADIGNIPNTGGVAQFFAGKDDICALADGLGKLSEPEVVRFFTTAGKLKDADFEGTKKLFQSLADIGNIPNTGGVAQWFAGSDDIGGLAEKMPEFGKSMALFYKSIEGITDFNKISQLFVALEDIGNIPNTGGVAQWFSGNDDIAGVGVALKQFGDNTKGFFEMVNALKVQNISLLFDALKNAQGMSESDFSQLPAKGTFLTGFMNNVKGFFQRAGKILVYVPAVKLVTEAVQNFFDKIGKTANSSLPNLQKTTALLTDIIAKIVDLPAKMKNSGVTAFTIFTQTIKTAFSNVQITVNQGIAKIVSSVSKLPQRMADAVKSSGTLLCSALANAWERAVGTSEKYINRLLNSTRQVMNTVGAGIGNNNGFGLYKYANGTSGHKGGNALVNDGRGAEIVQMPNGNAFIPNGRNVLIPNAPKGMQVLPAGLTAKIMGKNTPTYRYADGVGSAVSSFNSNNSYVPSSMPSSSNSMTEYNTYSPQFNLTVNGTNDRDTERKIKRWIDEALNEAFSSMERKNPRLREV